MQPLLLSADFACLCLRTFSAYKLTMASAADEDHVIPTSVHFDDAENQKPAASNIASVAATPFLTTKSAVSATTTPSKYYTPMRPPSSPTHRSTAKKGKVKAVDLVSSLRTGGQLTRGTALVYCALFLLLLLPSFLLLTCLPTFP